MRFYDFSIHALGENILEIRKIDTEGRIRIPINFRKALKISIGDKIIINCTEQSILIQKYMDGCVFCGNTRLLTQFENKQICEYCKCKLIDEEKKRNIIIQGNK